jgi:hypothetical protein
MLEEKGPSCFGGLGTIHIHVSGRWERKAIDADVDACTGNPAGEELWMSQLPRLRTFLVDFGALSLVGAS